MFSSIGLFRQIKCPEAPNCQLPQCIFCHEDLVGHGRSELRSTSAVNGKSEKTISAQEIKPPRKRRRVDVDSPFKRRSSLEAESKSSIYTGFHTSDRGRERNSSVSSLVRDASPQPLLKSQRATPNDTAQVKRSITQIGNASTEEKETPQLNKPATEPLYPRNLSKAPATHTIRLKLVVLLHEQLARLNNEVHTCKDKATAGLELSPQELIKEALDEEQRTANENPTVYTNVLKNRIGALKKMKLEEWKVERLRTSTDLSSSPVAPKSITSTRLDTGLSKEEEVALLSRLVCKQDGLSKNGYVTTIPSEAEIDIARNGVEASHGYEVCDRCKSRFQVFPGRRAEDGALTTGGKCTHHWGKTRRPAKEDANTGNRETFYTCCNQPLGSPGCATVDTHVFKISEAKRLALVMPFMATPIESTNIAANAVCFDCEMGYTTYGLELIRLTVTAWPDSKQVLDVLVRPLGEILDLNSRFSGVWPKQFQDAVPYEARGKDHKADQNDVLQLVESPFRARELFFEHLTTMTPLIGHALENDLNAIRVVHPTIVDTVLLYPHPRGLPIRHGLKMLVKKYLDKDIQMGGDQGHDSKEDAIAAGELVRLKVSEMWKGMRQDGWTIECGAFIPPSPGR